MNTRENADALMAVLLHGALERVEAAPNSRHCAGNSSLLVTFRQYRRGEDAMYG
jgi:hypothetical protein